MIVGLAWGNCLKAIGATLMEDAEIRFNETGLRQGLFGERSHTDVAGGRVQTILF